MGTVVICTVIAGVFAYLISVTSRTLSATDELKSELAALRREMQEKR